MSVGLLSYVSGQRFWFRQETETTGEEGRGSLILTKRPGGWLRERWGKLWSGLCGSCFGLAKREALAGSRRENPKLIFLSCFGQGGGQERDEGRGRQLVFFFFLVEIEKFLELSMCTSFKKILFLKMIT